MKITYLTPSIEKYELRACYIIAGIIHNYVCLYALLYMTRNTNLNTMKFPRFTIEGRYAHDGVPASRIVDHNILLF